MDCMFIVHPCKNTGTTVLYIGYLYEVVKYPLITFCEPNIRNTPMSSSQMLYYVCFTETQ